MRIGIVGGPPPALVPGGLALQIERTAGGLAALGHEVVRIECAGADAGWDVLHGLGAEPNLWYDLKHWTRRRTPLVISGVTLTSPGWEERLAVLQARVPILTAARMRRQLFEWADAVIGATEYEAAVARRILGRGRGARVHVVPNGADPAPGGDPPAGLPAGEWAAIVGTVDERKRTPETVAALGAGGVRAVVVGAWNGSEHDRAAFTELVQRADAVWTGPLPPGATRATVRRARVLVHLSTAETHAMAVLEALAEGTPVVLSDIPSHREHAAAHPDLVRIAARPEDVVGAIASLPPRETATPAPIPTFRDVASRLVEIYETLL